jgi:peptide/nickel transport system permease protein
VSFGLDRRGRDMAAFVARRTALAALVLIAVSFLVFAATSIAGGDAAVARLGANPPPDAVRALHHQLGLDRPWPLRYWSWLSGAVRGDFGSSYVTGNSVVGLIQGRGGNSLALGLLAAAVLVPCSIGLGLWAGMSAGRGPDRAVTTGASFLAATPEFVVGALLTLVFAVQLGWLPAVSAFTDGPLRHPAALVLPVASLVTLCLGQTVRLVRAGVVDVARSDAVEMARLNGIDERRVIWRWIIPAGVRPALPAFARNVAYLLGGTLVVETIFGFPGLASVLVQAVNNGDVPVVQGVAMVAAAVTVGLNLLSDVITLALDPLRRS